MQLVQDGRKGRSLLGEGSPFFTVTARQALVLCRKLLPAAGDRGRAAFLQPRAACKPRGSEKGLEGKQALLKAS